MNKKYLFGMLVSGALLTACTADDLDTASVIKDVNPSAPVFTVHFDGEDLQNRAYYDAGTGNIRFDEGIDHMSLFHGMARPTAYSTAPDLSKWQNALYTKSGSSNGVSNWTTPGVVNDGLAVMIYPGDTDFNNEIDKSYHTGTAAPNIIISLDQDKQTTSKTPYMSEFIDIANGWNKNNKDQAASGFQKEYDIALKRVGSTLNLKLDLKPFTEVGDLNELKNAKGEKIAEIAVKRVELVNNGPKNTSGTNGLFTYSIPVTLKYTEDGVVRPAAYDKDNDAHRTWYAASHLDFSGALGKDTISTTDLTVNDDHVLAVMTLLPFKSDLYNPAYNEGNGYDPEKNYWTVFDVSKGVANDVALVVYTNYGTVTVGGPGQDGDKVWYGKDDHQYRDRAKTMGAGIYGIAQYLWYNAEKGSTFYNDDKALMEQVGSRVTRWVDVEFDYKLQMDGIHIEDEDELLDALALYEKLQNRAKDETTFYLDGDKNGQFIMHEATWKKVNELYEKNPNNYGLGRVKCVPCGAAEKGAQCVQIVLVSDDKVREVPGLKLGKNTTDMGTEEKPFSAEVVLNGDWTWKEGEKTFEGVSNVIVNANSTLDIEGDVVFGGDEDEQPAGIDNFGTVDVKSGKTAVLRESTNNFNVINIGDNNARLEVAGENVILTNKQSTTPKATGITTTDRGVINNNGHLACQAAGQGEIYNYGLINHLKPTAHTTITTNSTEITDKETDGRNISKTFGSGEKEIYIGSIDMGYEISEYVNVKAEYKGFIKLHVKENNPSAEKIGTYVNYIVVEDGCDEITSGKVNAGKENEYTGWADNARHLEITNTAKEVNMRGSFVLSSMVMQPGTNAWLVNTATLRVGLTSSGNPIKGSGCFYLKGILDGAGTVTYNETMTTFTGYYGGKDKDIDNLKVETGK